MLEQEVPVFNCRALYRRQYIFRCFFKHFIFSLRMASLYGVNPNTIQRGLSELKRKGLISGHHTRGFRVIMDIELIAAYKTQKVQSILRSFLRQMESLGYTKEQTVAALLSKKMLILKRSIG